MSPTVAEASRRLGDAIDLSKAAHWDPVGLQVGDPAAPVDRVAVCHEVTPDVVAAATQADVDLLVSYHPLLFSPTKRFVQGGSAAGRAFQLATAGVALHVVHTAFDVAPGGCAEALAEALGVPEPSEFGMAQRPESRKIVTYLDLAPGEDAMAALDTSRIGLSDSQGLWSMRSGDDPARLEMTVPVASADTVIAALAAGYHRHDPHFEIFHVRPIGGFVGRVGHLPEPVSLRSFVSRTNEVLGPQIRVAGDAESLIATVAVVPGSGGDLIAAARGAGADVLVTGDVSHHRAHDALQRGLAVIDAGHAATERPGVARLYSLISSMFEKVTDLTHIEASPWGSE